MQYRLSIGCFNALQSLNVRDNDRSNINDSTSCYQLKESFLIFTVYWLSNVHQLPKKLLNPQYVFLTQYFLSQYTVQLLYIKHCIK